MLMLTLDFSSRDWGTRQVERKLNAFLMKTLSRAFRSSDWAEGLPSNRTMTLSSQQEWFIDNSGNILEWPSQAWLVTKMNSLCVNTLGNKALSDSETFLEIPENVYQPSSNMTELERRRMANKCRCAKLKLI